MSQEQTSSQRGPVVVPPPPRAGEVPVLQKLSSPPFPRSGFPLLGILASVYEHVVSVAGRGRGGPAGAATTQEPLSPQNTSR